MFFFEPQAKLAAQAPLRLAFFLRHGWWFYAPTLSRFATPGVPPGVAGLWDHLAHHLHLGRKLGEVLRDQEARGY